MTRELIADLERRGLLFREQVYEHSYPHCWRCGTPLLYYATSSWYVAHLRGQGAAARQQRDDRLAPRARQARPLRQMAGEQRRLGALARPLLGHAAADLALRRPRLRRARLRRLGRRAGRARPGRRSRRTCTAPTSTRSTLECGKCGGEMRRVESVIDTWYDSGAMPFAQFHYPFENAGRVRGALPGRLHLRGPGPDPRLVLHAARRVDAALRRRRATATASASA